MTRINAGISPAELPGKLLLAELREIKRIPNLIKNGKYNLDGTPEKFTLGTGHVKFFYDKGLYLLKRYMELRNEALNRGYQVTNFIDAWQGYPPDLYNDWNDLEARSYLIERIREKGFNLIKND